MRWRLDPRLWPLTVKVPLVVAGLMIAVATTVSQIVLARLIDTQEENLRQLTATYLDGISAAAMPHVQRQDSWEVFDVLDRTRRQYADVKATLTVVTQSDGAVIAASDPKVVPIGAKFDTGGSQSRGADAHPYIDEQQGIAWYSKELSQDGRTVGAVHAAIDVRSMFATRQSVTMSLVVGNALLTLLFAGGGYVAVRRMVDPIRLVGEYVENIRDGHNGPFRHANRFPDHTEFGTLFRRLNELSDAIAERESLTTKLAEEEKLALIGKLTSAVAHEVNNPLGGMRNTIDTLRRHGENPQVRETSLSLLDRGLAGIANVVRAALVTYRGRHDAASLARTDVEDLKHLIAHDVKQRKITLEWENSLPDAVEIEAGAVRQVLLNLLLNACKATPLGGTVLFRAALADGMLHAEIGDQGCGMPEAAIDQLHEPRIKDLADLGGGLGVWTVGTLVRRLDGWIDIEKVPGGGTRVVLVLPVKRKEQIDAVA